MTEIKNEKKEALKPLENGSKAKEVEIPKAGEVQKTKEISKGEIKEEDYKRKYEESAKEAKENYNKWLYLYADFENYKKKIFKEKLDLIKYGNEEFAYELLNVLDALEAALNHADGASEGLKDGIKLTLKQFLTIFEKFGITPIKSMDVKFDPRFHEAIHEEEDQAHETGVIIREMKKGYLLHERVLRAAQVIVAKKAAKN